MGRGEGGIFAVLTSMLFRLATKHLSAPMKLMPADVQLHFQCDAGEVRRYAGAADSSGVALVRTKPQLLNLRAVSAAACSVNPTMTLPISTAGTLVSASRTDHVASGSRCVTYRAMLPIITPRRAIPQFLERGDLQSPKRDRSCFARRQFQFSYLRKV
jgi:hypothetical protein